LLICAGAIAIFFLMAAAGCVTVFHSPLLTHYIESDSFRQAMETETAKGLHFVECRYSPIRRTSTFTAQSDRSLSRASLSPIRRLVKKAFSHD
jgi:hypothetical protein